MAFMHDVRVVRVLFASGDAYHPAAFHEMVILSAGKRAAVAGLHDFHAGVRHDASGRLVGWSALHFDVAETAHAWQGTTIVDPAHRGHGLGLLVKLENLFRTREVQPDLRQVDTWNAAENEHMIAINEAIGFRALDAWVDCQYDIPTETLVAPAPTAAASASTD